MKIADLYRKSIWDHIVYLGEDEELLALIGDAVRRLPDEALLLATERCVFVSVGRTAEGLTLPPYVLQHGEDGDNLHWLILLDDGMMNDKAADDVESVIAHELAHAVLGHDRMADDGDRSIELAAVRLAREWGFEGSGTDESRHH